MHSNPCLTCQSLNWMSVWWKNCHECEEEEKEKVRGFLHAQLTGHATETSFSSSFFSSFGPFPTSSPHANGRCKRIDRLWNPALPHWFILGLTEGDVSQCLLSVNQTYSHFVFFRIAKKKCAFTSALACMLVACLLIHGLFNLHGWSQHAGCRSWRAWQVFKRNACWPFASSRSAAGRRRFVIQMWSAETCRHTKQEKYQRAPSKAWRNISPL